MKALEVWGGAECTINRVGDHYRNQFTLSGHDQRPGDLDLLADLGLSAVRLPVLWEKVAPDRLGERDWDWSDRTVARLQQLAILPIVGLIHHGSGPSHTSLLHDDFAAGLAEHALAVARRYPWVDEWTPVNEPLTTARFSALYGHWYPHARDERLFWIALINQVDGVRLAMRAIRSVNTDARLIQTEDLGRTYATASLAGQAAFDNDRRWMTFDLLCGRVLPGHPLWPRLCGMGLERRLRAIADDPCVPEVIGINHYLTSDRFLDHRLERYPVHTHGGNENARYADVEAIRVLDPPPQGLRGAIAEAWERYGVPLALTEVHNGCTREEQLRWLDEAWHAVHEARDGGVELQAMTPWALFGSHGWNTLLTATGAYEPGAFDVSSGAPRPTAVATLIKSYTRGGDKPRAVEGSGWWRRPIRFAHPKVQRPAPMREYLQAGTTGDLPRDPIMVTGATGTLGQAMAAACRHRDLAYVLTSRAELDLLDPSSIAAALDRYKPWAVVNTAGWVRVDEAEQEDAACAGINCDGAVALATACRERGVRTLDFSSDLVFDGTLDRLYTESDAPNPVNNYGSSKASMEKALLAAGGDHLIVRTAAFFSPYDQANFAIHTVRNLAAGNRFRAADDRLVTPTYVPDLCNASLDLLIDGETGIWHLSNQEPLSWAEFAVRVAEACGLDASMIERTGADQLGWLAQRPRSCGLGSERGVLMPSLDRAIERFAQVARPGLAEQFGLDLSGAERPRPVCDERTAPPGTVPAGAEPGDDGSHRRASAG